MATVIRFARHGSKKRPYFRIVVQDKRAPRDGRFIDHIGAFDPVRGDSSVTVIKERLQYWLSTGAEMSTSVKNRLRPKLAEWRNESATDVTTKPAPESQRPSETK